MNNLEKTQRVNKTIDKEKKSQILDKVSMFGLPEYLEYLNEDNENLIKYDKDIQKVVVDDIIGSFEYYISGSSTEYIPYIFEIAEENNELQEIIKEEITHNNTLLLRILELLTVNNSPVEHNKILENIFFQKLLKNTFPYFIYDEYNIDDESNLFFDQYNINDISNLFLKFANDDLRSFITRKIEERKKIEEDLIKRINNNENLYDIIRDIIDSGYTKFFLKNIYSFFSKSDMDSIIKILKLFSDFGKGEAIDECLPEVTDELEELLSYRRNRSHKYSQERLQTFNDKTKEHYKFIEENNGFDIEDPEAIAKYEKFYRENFSSEYMDDDFFRIQLKKKELIKELKKKHQIIFEKNKKEKLGENLVEDELEFYDRIEKLKYKFAIYRTQENKERDEYSIMYYLSSSYRRLYDKKSLNRSELEQNLMFLRNICCMFHYDDKFYLDNLFIDKSVDYYTQKKLIFDEYLEKIKDLYNYQMSMHSLDSKFEFKNKREMYMSDGGNFEQSGVIAEAMVLSELKRFINKINLPRGMKISIDHGILFEDYEYKADIVIRVKKKDEKLKRYGIQLALVEPHNDGLYLNRKKEQIKSVLENYDYLEDLKLVTVSVNWFWEPKEALKEWRHENWHDEERKLPQDYLDGFHKQNIVKKCFDGILPESYFKELDQLEK